MKNSTMSNFLDPYSQIPRVKPSWATDDGYQPTYPIPPHRPDLRTIAAIDSALIPVVSSMKRYGVSIDLPYLADLRTNVVKHIAEVKEEIFDLLPGHAVDKLLSRVVTRDMEEGLEEGLEESGDGDDDNSGFGDAKESGDYSISWDVNKSNLDNLINLDSPNQLSELLFTVLGIGDKSTLKTTKSGAISTDKEQLNNLKVQAPIIGKILEYREYVKGLGTYIDAMPRLAVKHPASTRGAKSCHLCGRYHRRDEWKIHTTFLLTRAVTGRLASKKPNLQNIPARTKLGKMIRLAFVPELGYVFLDCDYSGAELRLLGHRAQEHNIINIFNAGEDIHTRTAMLVFKLDKPELVDPELQRAPCKNVNFGIVYGLTAQGLFDQLVLTYATALKPVPDWLTITWCENFIALWFAAYPEVEAYLKLEHERVLKYNCVWTDYGRFRRIFEGESVHKHIRQAGYRAAGNMPIQGDCAEIVRIAMAVVYNYYEQFQGDGHKRRSYMNLSIHDQLITESPEEWGKEQLASQKQLMEGVTEDWMVIKMKADGKLNDRWRK